MYWSVFLLSTRINPFGRANIMALAGKRGVDSSSALREGDQTRIDLTFGRQRAPSDRSAGPLPAACDGGMQHISPVVTSPTSPSCTSSTGKSQCVGLPRGSRFRVLRQSQGRGGQVGWSRRADGRIGGARTAWLWLPARMAFTRSKGRQSFKQNLLRFGLQGPRGAVWCK
jgi:hypothetical protein